MKNKNDYYKYILGLIIICFSLYYIIYCNSVMTELPYLTWFDQMKLADAFLKGTFNIGDLFSKYGEHGLLANNILWLVNVVFFHGTTLFDVYINDINVVLLGSIVIYKTYKSIKDKIAVFCCVVEGLFLFSCTQASSGGMETQVRLGILLFVVCMLFVDDEFENKGEGSEGKNHLLLTLVLIIISINVFGTLYSFAGVPLVWAICVGKVIKKDDIKRYGIIATTYLITIPCYLMEYRVWNTITSKSNKNGGMISGIVGIFVNPLNTIKAFCSWCSNGVLGWGYYQNGDYSSNVWLGIGGIIFVVMLIAIVIFFFGKMYEHTYLPLMLIVYSIGVFMLVYLGRENDWEWFANEWYNVHIKIMLAGITWIIMWYVKKKNTVIRYIVYISIVMFMFMMSIVGNKYSFERAPFLRAYYEGMQPYLYIQRKEDMPVDDEGMTPLLHDIDTTMESIEILKKYRLSVYRYWGGV